VFPQVRLSAVVLELVRENREHGCPEASREGVLPFGQLCAALRR